jgi:hypothetical protein
MSYHRNIDKPKPQTPPNKSCDVSRREMPHIIGHATTLVTTSGKNVSRGWQPRRRALGPRTCAPMRLCVRPMSTSASAWSCEWCLARINVPCWWKDKVGGERTRWERIKFLCISEIFTGNVTDVLQVLILGVFESMSYFLAHLFLT